MGQKVNPHGLRVGVIKDWDSRWFVKDSEFGKTLVSDYNLRKFLKKNLFEAKVPKIEIERDNQRARIIIHCAMPGRVIGKGGSEIDRLKDEIEKILGKPASVNVVEVKYPDLNAQLVAENIAEQLEKRISFRRAMKQAIARTMKLGAKGIKIAVSGLLGGADIARTEHYHEGTIPLQTIRADIDYGHYAALTKMGLIGIKVWIYKGEVLTAVKRDAKSEADRSRVRDNLPPRKDRPQRGDRFDRDSDEKQAFARSDRPHQPRENRDGRDNRERSGRPPYQPHQPYQSYQPRETREPRIDGQQGQQGQQGENAARDNRDNRDNRGRGERIGGFNRDNRDNRGDRNKDRQSAPPANFGNRKTGFQKNQQRRTTKPETGNAPAEVINSDAQGQTEQILNENQSGGGTNDVNA